MNGMGERTLGVAEGSWWYLANCVEYVSMTLCIWDADISGFRIQEFGGSVEYWNRTVDSTRVLVLCSIYIGVIV